MMTPAEISTLIRRKKKKAMEAEPELVDTDLVRKNPIDIMTDKMNGEIQDTLKTPEKRDARDHQPEPEDSNIGPSDKDKARMARLRSMLSSMSMGR